MRPNKMIIKSILPDLVLFALGLLLLLLVSTVGGSVLWVFLLLFMLRVFIERKTEILSPITAVLAYYGLWFVVGPLFAARYSGFFERNPEANMAYLMVFTVFSLALLSSKIGTYLGKRYSREKSRQRSTVVKLSQRPHKKFVLLFGFLATIAIVCIIQASGGIGVWISDPGEAFLNRSGSGIFVVISHFFTYLFALGSGYLVFSHGEKKYSLLFLAWLAGTSPVHGSKVQILYFLLAFLMLPLRNVNLLSRTTVLTGIAGLFIFIGGMWFRNFTWISLDTIVPYSLNYFNTLELLVLSLKDFYPFDVFTFFLPFNKFLSPFGLSDPSLYYDMNHLLTDLYFPTSWEIRATEQWPVETDLYLNFSFVFGLPLIILFFSFLGFIHGASTKRASVSYCFLGLACTFSVIPHLRGSLINHTDFYLYPLYLGIFFVLKILWPDTSSSIAAGSDRA